MSEASASMGRRVSRGTPDISHLSTATVTYSTANDIGSRSTTTGTTSVHVHGTLAMLSGPGVAATTGAGDHAYAGAAAGGKAGGCPGGHEGGGGATGGGGGAPSGSRGGGGGGPGGKAAHDGWAGHAVCGDAV